ncbi:MAG: hypothetical protein IKE21_03105 [Erysipelotrichaceae bacterium]|nr:hypothetical protein [Erysipelotrichaceae bacterium]
MRSRKAFRIYLVFLLGCLLAALAGHAAGIVFRQYLRIMAVLLVGGGLFFVSLVKIRELPAQQKGKRAAATVLLCIFCLLLGFGLFITLGSEKERTVERDGRKMIETESGFLLFLERSYYDYGNLFWYRKDPHYTISYDDGDPSQPVYTDYFNENGELSERIFVQE